MADNDIVARVYLVDKSKKIFNVIRCAWVENIHRKQYAYEMCQYFNKNLGASLKDRYEYRVYEEPRLSLKGN